MKTLAHFKQFHHYYKSIEQLQTGIQLTGPEVKSCKLGRVIFKGAYSTLDSSQNLILHNLLIEAYPPAKNEQKYYQPQRDRQLLVTKKELRQLDSKLKNISGSSLIPYKFLLNHGFVKLELHLVTGLKKVDKRQKIKKEDIDRRIKRLTR